MHTQNKKQQSDKRCINVFKKSAKNRIYFYLERCAKAEIIKECISYWRKKVEAQKKLLNRLSVGRIMQQFSN